MKIAIRTLAIISTLIIINACANIGRPSGGPRDYDPPIFLRSTPTPNETNSSKSKIELEFNEIILVEKISEKVIVSPPQKAMPIIRTSGRKVYVELNDTLLENMTYVIDFADAIVDNNEKNPLNNFAFAFSTGNHIDTMEISGMLLNAENLEPITGMMVGLTNDNSDSTFTKVPFSKITQSDIYGRFTVKHIADTTYQVFALKDINRTYTFDLPNEEIAFADSSYRATPYLMEVTDTLFSPLGEVDSIFTHKEYRYKPDDILLLSFSEDFKMRYLDKSERRQRNKISLFFTSPTDSLPKIEPINFTSNDWNVIERSIGNDTLHYWIVDSLVAKMDTILLETTYLRTDSTMALTPQTDTLRFLFRDAPPPKKENKRKKDQEEEKPQMHFFDFSSKLSGTIDIYESGFLKFNQPIDSIKLDNIKLEVKADTLWAPTEFTIEIDSLSKSRLQIVKKWEASAEYQLTIDSASIFDHFGLHNNYTQQIFKVKPLEEYGGLFLSIKGVPDSTAAFVELLSKDDKPIRREPVINGEAEFFYLRADTYFARIIIDLNGDGKWTTGKWSERRQPEPVYYYPGSFQLRQNWDVEQDWDILATPIEKQKPKEITKNKPKEVDLNAEDKNTSGQNNQGSNNSLGSFGGSNNSSNSIVTSGKR
ncbi:MAG: Ig-like domain-containing protein [Bacteroidales bacterium]